MHINLSTRHTTAHVLFQMIALKKLQKDYMKICHPYLPDHAETTRCRNAVGQVQNKIKESLPSIQLCRWSRFIAN